MKFLFDFFPVLLFFVAYKFANIYVATGTAIGATVLQLIFARVVLKRIEPMLWLSATIVIVFGSLTLILHNPTFIKWKPTVLYWCMAVSLAVGPWLFGRNLIRKALEEQVKLPDAIWGRLNLAWVFFLAGMGALNIFVAYHFSEAIWVNFKLFGSMGLMLLFVLGQALFLSRHIEEPES